MTNADIEVTDNEAAHRFEARIGDLVAVLKYRRTGDHVTMRHTEVPPALEGHGIAGKLAQTALEDARARNLPVIPVCEFVQSYIRRHPEYLPLIAPSYRARLG
jgi:predicted GNAT family acetyltransferase